jgi:hypothetical protein
MPLDKDIFDTTSLLKSVTISESELSFQLLFSLQRYISFVTFFAVIVFMLSSISLPISIQFQYHETSAHAVVRQPHDCFLGNGEDYRYPTISSLSMFG